MGKTISLLSKSVTRYEDRLQKQREEIRELALYKRVSRSLQNENTSLQVKAQTTAAAAAEAQMAAAAAVEAELIEKEQAAA